MRNIRIKIFAAILALLSAGFAAESFAAEKATLAITKITVNSGVSKGIRSDGNSLQRIVESLASHIASSIQRTRKFEIVTRSDLDALSKESALSESGNVDSLDENAAKSNSLKGAKYILTVSINDFQDYFERAKFASLNKSVEKRVIRLGAVAKIIDSSTGSILEIADVSVSDNDISDKSSSISSDGNLNDSLISEMARKLSDEIVQKISDAVFPARIVGIMGSTASINRGEGTGIKVGDAYEIFAQGRDMIDPDTGEKLGAMEASTGKLRITLVAPKFSTGKLIVNDGVELGQIARKRSDNSSGE